MPTDRAAKRLTWGVQLAVVLVLSLLAFGWILVPAAVPIGATAVLVAYAIVVYVGDRMYRGGIARTDLIILACGVASAAVLIRAVAVQYLGRTADNAIMVIVVLALWLVPGVVAAARTRGIGHAVFSSTLSAQIGSLANVAFILASYYVLRGSPAQERFFRLEGTYDDFARSGVADFGTFVTGDLFGGAFFHLLLGGVFGALLGAIGGALTVVLIRVLKLPDRRANAIAGRIPPCV